ncbi:hypothetical protein OCU04_010965 [Sclerotinia nivalis]|uniref:Uncharacterized protein n=1 Tax=Sclerotinia nivalis TaxID=352851 RepID=A0A9X0AD67_9HELO|nr:hypothetical protein OCU04_010965 [Sclerotinia nivalis]
MMVLAEGYEPKRHNLQLLVSQINECHVCWFPDPESQPQMKQEGETSTDSGGGRQEGNGKGRADD